LKNRFDRSTLTDLHERSPTGHRRGRCGRFAGFFGLLVLAACLPGARPENPTLLADPGNSGAAARVSADPISSEARPPFFRVLGPTGSRLYVLGTVHVGPSQGWRLSPEVDRAIVDADRFFLELDLRKLDDEAVGDLLASMVLLPPGRTIDQVIAPETAALLSKQDALLARYGLPRNARVRFEPWYVAVSLAQVAATESGYSLDRAVENDLMERLDGRPLRGLETFDAQMRMMDQLDPAAQDAMLRDTLLRLEDAAEELERLIQAWREADRESLRSIARQGLDELPALNGFYDRLLVDRNAAWMTILRAYLDDPALEHQDAFVAVGALHLVGPDGLETRFREAGYVVDRIH
jgi:uncharacterized protein YbaP (TraB family)